MKRLIASSFTLASVTLAGTAHATIVDPLASGHVDATAVLTSESSSWATADLTSSANPGFPGFTSSTDPWPGTIQAGSGHAELAKIANGLGGGPYPATESLYFGGFSSTPNTYGGTLAVTSNIPLVDLNFVTFQFTMGEADGGYDLFNHQLPTLNFNDLQGTAATSFSVDRLETGAVFPNPVTREDEPLFENTYFLTWDLREVQEAIEWFSIEFSGAQHARLYELRLDQYVLSNDDGGGVVVDPNEPDPVVVPTPSALGLGLLGGSLMLMRRRRSQ